MALRDDVTTGELGSLARRFFGVDTFRLLCALTQIQQTEGQNRCEWDVVCHQPFVFLREDAGPLTALHEVVHAYCWLVRPDEMRELMDLCAVEACEAPAYYATLQVAGDENVAVQAANHLARELPRDHLAALKRAVCRLLRGPRDRGRSPASIVEDMIVEAHRLYTVKWEETDGGRGDDGQAEADTVPG